MSCWYTARGVAAEDERHERLGILLWEISLLTQTFDCQKSSPFLFKVALTADYSSAGALMNVTHSLAAPPMLDHCGY